MTHTYKAAHIAIKVEAQMDGKLNVGIIGCGWAGEQHASSYASLKDTRLLAVCDVDEDRARSFARKWGAEAWHKDHRGLLADPRIGAISICLPHYLHSLVAVDSAEAGKHILCEKPMAIRLEEADAMIAAARKAEVVLMIAENVRFHPINIKIRELIQDGYIGDIFLARIFRDHEMHDSLRKRPWFLDKKKAGGGIWMSGGIHDIDALRMLVGEVETIAVFQARSVFPEMQGDDTVAALLKFANGAVGVVTESFSAKTFRPLSPIGCPTLLNGNLGTIAVSEDIEVYGDRIAEKSPMLRIKVDETDTFLEEIRHFADCIRREGMPLTSGEEERKTLAVICSGYESLSKDGIPVKVTY